ncbi:MAG: MBL fold metallo-hydrolase, partial [Rhodospirillaceae bacterium]
MFLPLGGSGEIGMNLNLYGHAGKWLMVDLGIAFGDETMPGIDVLVPDPSFIRERKADLVGLVLTHAHEDHLGAVQHLWPELECPVYAS